MEETKKYEPLRLKPCLRSYLWGGTRLREEYHKTGEGVIAESWELSVRADGQTYIDSGEYCGESLADVLRADPVGMAGTRCGIAPFPLLIKLIDAQKDLSVQVHPSDASACREKGEQGKTEMWYVVDGAPGAYLLDGFSRQVTADEYAARVADQTLPEVLRRYDVRPGDVYYLPAGRVHSIGTGCFICEIQQSSDVTYRIYDFGRVDSEGRPRQLHVEEAKEAIDYTVTEPETRREIEANVPAELVRSPFFTTSAYRLTDPMTCDYADLDSFVILICTKGACRVSCGEEEVKLTAGHTLLVSAEAENVTLAPEGETTILESYV